MRLARPVDLAAYREALADQIAQVLDVASPFVHGATPGVCDALLYALIEAAQSVGLRPDVYPYTRAFETLPAVATYRATRPRMYVHAPFVAHHVKCSCTQQLFFHQPLYGLTYALCEAALVMERCPCPLLEATKPPHPVVAGRRARTPDPLAQRERRDKGQIAFKALATEHQRQVSHV